MGDLLSVYLHDHLAGSHFAIKLLGALHDQYPGQELGGFAQTLRTEVEQDQEALQEIAKRVGGAHLDLTEAAGWLAEKASQIKLTGDDSDGGLGTFEALETLALGVQGKLSLWQVLPIIRGVDSRIPPHDYSKLAGRARDQLKRLEEHRLKLALVTFEPVAK
jgi:hypothetical protein